MNRPAVLTLIAVVLALYGVYAASFVPPMLVGTGVVGLLTAFVLQAVCALLAAFGVWRRARWAAGAVVLLGICIAGTWLLEAFILGIVPYLRALLVAGIAVLVTFIIAAYISRQDAAIKSYS